MREALSTIIVTLLRSNKTYEFQIDGYIIKKSDFQKLLGAKITSKISFNATLEN